VVARWCERDAVYDPWFYSTASADGGVPGSFINADGTLTPCGEDTFLDGSNSTATCQPCPAGLTTNGTLGNARCRFVKPGFRFNTGTGAAEPCPANTASNRVRNLRATTCPACGRGASTNGTTGNVVCGKGSCRVYALP
jgi:hypothetical protein